MNRMSIKVALTLIATLGLPMAAGADAMRYTVTDLGTLPGTNWSAARALNNRGDIIGSTEGASFLYSEGLLGRLPSSPTAFNDSRQLAFQTASYSPRAINASGQTAGHTTNVRPAIESGGQVTLLPGRSDNGSAADINDSGQVVGSMRFYEPFMLPTTHAFLYSDGKVTDLAASPTEYSLAAAINNLGQVVGTRGPSPDAAQPFLYSDGKFTDLPFLGGALGINDSGQIIGYKGNDPVWHRAFLYQDGQLTDLTGLIEATMPLKLGPVSLVGINDAGQIAFNAVVDGQSHTFLMTPQAVPEPTSLVLGAIAIASVAVARRRRLVGGCRP